MTQNKITPEQQKVWDILNPNAKEARERRMLEGIVRGMSRVLSVPKKGYPTK